MSVPPICQKCEGGELRRLNRSGFLERRVLKALGVYPWECVICRGKCYLRDNGHSGLQRRSSGSSGKSPGEKFAA